MPVLDYEGLKIELDEEGYLVNPDDWNEKIACVLADKEGVSKTCPLTQDKIDILIFMREYYKKYKAFAIPRAVCKNVHQPRECLYEEFPDPLVAWKIAGLPNLHPEVYAYFHRLKVK